MSSIESEISSEDQALLDRIAALKIGRYERHVNEIVDESIKILSELFETLPPPEIGSYEAKIATGMVRAILCATDRVCD
jgi:hypothetical protein